MQSAIAQFIIEHFVEGAVYLIALLAGLLYKLQQQKAAEAKTLYTAELTVLREALAKTISQDYFKEHVARQEDERKERRAAEHNIREMVGTLDMRMQLSLATIDTKMDGKLNTIINNMLEVARSPHNRRAEDA